MSETESIVNRESYHHGDLHQSLINAAIQLVREKGPDKFSMTDACKLAGVSKAAPYRHFANKDALLTSVVSRGFEQMYDDMLMASEKLVPGSNDRIIAIGLTYKAFAIREPALFKLMFGNSKEIDKLETNSSDKPTFQILLDQIIARTQLKDRERLMEVAFPLWTLVHGAAILTIDNSYERIYPESNVNKMIINATIQLLANFPEPKAV